MKIDDQKLQAERVEDLKALADKVQQLTEAMSALRMENTRLKIENAGLRKPVKHTRT